MIRHLHILPVRRRLQLSKILLWRGGEFASRNDSAPIGHEIAPATLVRALSGEGIRVHVYRRLTSILNDMARRPTLPYGRRSA